MSSVTVNQKSPSASRRRRISMIIRMIIAIVMIFFALFPAAWAVSASLNPVGNLASSTLIPANASLLERIADRIGMLVNGALVVPKLHQAMGLDFLHLLMDERLVGVRRYLIQGAAKGANLPSPLVFLIVGAVLLGIGHLILGFAKAIQKAR